MNKEKLIWPITIIIILIIGLVFYFLQINKQGDLFTKKLRCEKYKSDIELKIKSYNNSQKPEIRNSNNDLDGEPINNLYIENKELKEIFYSPKLDSCVYVESNKTLAKRGVDINSSGDFDVVYETYYIIDILSGNKKIDFNNGLNFLQIINRGEVFSSEDNTNKIINEYK